MRRRRMRDQNGGSTSKSDEEPISRVPVWGILRADGGYLYMIEDKHRLKIGKTRTRSGRLSAAKTWLPDMRVVGIKPFWNINELERQLHIGLAQWWYEGEWFDLGNDPYREDLIWNFEAFSDRDEERDMNSVNFIYWMHDMGEIAMEFSRRNQTRRAFQRDLSETKRRR